MIRVSANPGLAQSYGEAGEWLYRRVVDVTGREPGWREGLRAGLAELLEFCANRPALARALFVEIHAATKVFAGSSLPTRCLMNNLPF